MGELHALVTATTSSHILHFPLHSQRLTRSLTSEQRRAVLATFIDNDILGCAVSSPYQVCQNECTAQPHPVTTPLPAGLSGGDADLQEPSAPRAPVSIVQHPLLTAVWSQLPLQLPSNAAGLVQGNDGGRRGHTY